MSYDVFISYARGDDEESYIARLVEIVTEEYKKLTRNSLEVFFDTRGGVEGPVAFQERIDDALKSRPILLAFITPSYFSSKHCLIEALNSILGS